MKKRAFRLEVGRGKVERDVDSELQFHIEMRTQKLAAQGMSPERAREEALRQFGDLSSVRDEVITIDRQYDRTRRAIIRMENIRQDLVFALRALAKRPGFTAIILAMLALGIGANTAMFSLVDALMLRTLPVQEPQRLASVGDPARVGSFSFGPPMASLMSVPLFKDIQAGSKGIFTSVYATGNTPTLDVHVERGADGGVRAGTEAEHPRARYVSGAFWKTLGVTPQRGRFFGEEADAGPGAAPEVVISHRWWTNRFANDPAVVGRVITVNNVALTIVGIGPEGFFGDIVGSRIDLWLPLTLQPLLDNQSLMDNRNASFLNIMGRLADGVTVERARSTLVPMIERTILTNARGDDVAGAKETLKRMPPSVHPAARGFSFYRRSYGPALYTLSAAVVLVLLVACANVANLMLARATSRGREMSVRLAVGASRARLVMQLLVESLTLGLAGGALGIAVGWWGSAVLLQLASAGPEPIPLGARVDGRVLLFTAALSAGTAILFGLAPAIHSTRVELATALRGAANAVTGGPRGRMQIGRALVVGQVGLSLLLLVATAMLVRSMQRIDQADIGVARDNLVIAEVRVARSGWEGERTPAMLDLLTEKLRQTPGVIDATHSLTGIFSGFHANSSVQVPGFKPVTEGDSVVDFDRVGPNYAKATGARLLRGRDILDSDRGTSERVALVNEAFAKHFYKGGDPIGQNVTMDSATFRIVGVIGDVQTNDVRGRIVPKLYMPRMQQTVEQLQGGHRFIIRTAGDPNAMIEPLMRAMKEAVPTMQKPNIETLPAMVRESVMQDRLVARVVTVFGFLTLALASLGLYGVMAYATARREREFGLRMALGATEGTVVRLVLRDALTLLGVGVLIGLPATWFAVRMIRDQIFGIGLVDLPSIVLAIAVLATAIALAGWLPARKAAGVPPDVALRAD